MRRKVSQSRDDAYTSFRDYQVLHEKRSLRIEALEENERVVVFRGHVEEDAGYAHVGFGGFFLPAATTVLDVTLRVGEELSRKTFQLSQTWNRLGVATPAETPQPIEVTLRWPGGVAMNLWGLNAGAVTSLPAAVAADLSADDLQKSHLAPETFFLSHDTATALEIEEGRSGRLALVPGEAINLKKCAYCSRLLPVNMVRLGSLSFHTHRDKKTLHQNECRACKKWRINDDFNPKRTTDQLHESSVITRERSIFLREPTILQDIKSKTGEGLKSLVWKRFGRKCFYCERPLELREVQLDHTRPLAYLWPIDEYATCLCAEHNNMKKEKFPVDFYSDSQLRQLSKITGLSYEELSKKEVNERELSRILADISTFAKLWEPRTFASIARRTAEIRTDVDLFALLEKADPTTHAEVTESLRDRPLPVSAAAEGELPLPLL